MGDTGLTLCPIGFGAFKIGRDAGGKFGHRYDVPDDAAADRLLNSVLDLGVTYVDTAPAYGLSEDRIGRFIGHRRDEYVVSTKVGETFAGGESTHDFSAAAVRGSVESSLRNLKRDVLDIVFVHAHRDDARILAETDVAETLAGLRERGLVRHIGFSGYSAEGFRLALSWSDAIMIEYHADDCSLQPVIAEAGERGVMVVVKKGLACGKLDAERAVRFVLSHESVSSLVVGTLNVDHLAANLRAAEAVRGCWRS